MLTFSQFKFHLARYAEVSEADAELFMNTVTQVLLEQLKAGEEVTIQGLGTFSVVETQQGRRLAFQVDDKMRQRNDGDARIPRPPQLLSYPHCQQQGKRDDAKPF